MKSMFKNIAVALTVAAAFALSACGTLNPLSHAQTVEQKAYALYGEFTVVEEQAAAVVNDASIPGSAKHALADADGVAKATADSLLSAAVEVKTIRDQLAAGKTTEDKLVVATANLQTWYAELSKRLGALADAVSKVHK